MLDPFFSLPPQLVSVIQPVFDYFNLWTLPLHIHEVVFAWACYHFINTIASPAFSAWIFPDVYRRLPAPTRLNWNIHVTSLVQSSLITTLALYVIRNDEERKIMDWNARIWGYTGAGGLVQALAAGYFLWDITVSLRHIDVLGWSSLAHAVSALLVTGLGFRPFANYYGLNFILYEISTPFLNIHWFCDKLGKTGSRTQFVNGVVLLVSFFACRVVWGNYQSIRIYLDVWKAIHMPVQELSAVNNSSFISGQNFPGLKMSSGNPSGQLSLPIWLAFVYLGSNTVLNLLNVFWFVKMIQALKKRIRPQAPEEKKRREETRTT